MISKNLFFLLFVMANSHMAQKNDFSLTGKTSDIEDNTYLYFRDLANGGDIDSAIVRDNSFQFTTELPEPILYVMLFTKDKSKFVELWLENSPMTFDSTKGDFKDAEVTGSKNHTLARSVQNEVYAYVRTTSRDTINQREKAFLNKHPNALVSAYILTMAKRDWKQEEVAEYYSKLTKEIQTSSIGLKVAKYLEKKIPEIGEQYADLKVLSSNCETVKISDLVGKLTLLQFWSSSCGSSRKMNVKTLTEIYSKYHPEGFEIITVSGDSSQDSWRKAIQEDRLNWPEVNNLISTNYDAFNAYGVSSTPSNFLINSNGIIVERNLMGNELEIKIKEYLTN